ncbi:MAG: radical SAM family heme chaperone HemW [Crocinitomicaceae bacterium]|nr:radical SAM family heme chaperone HemW [Crocinitomicaceae bacterium]
MAGIYIHIPFCKQKCTYCDFHFSTTYQAYEQEMIDSFVKEIELRKAYLAGQTVETIYFGGGTPSLLNQEQLTTILTAVRENLTCSESPEITLEANPDDITAEKANAWKMAGVNRLSVGIQSFDDCDLKWMNRAHDSQQALNCLPIAQEAGIKNISLDLIYGLPDLDNERWKKQIEKAVSLGATHISAYCLTIEKKTALHQLVQQKKLIPAENEQQSEQFEILIKTLKGHGFDHYEISNFALPGFISKHNSNYWRGISYLGVGPSAHSYNGKSRSWNISNNPNYIKFLQKETFETFDWYEEEHLTPENIFNESLLIGLRTSWGVDLTALNAVLELDFKFNEKVDHYKAKGWMFESNEHLILTESGRHWADAIAEDFFI